MRLIVFAVLTGAVVSLESDPDAVATLMSALVIPKETIWT